MEKTMHKHIGVVRSDGSLRLHPISRKHKNSTVKRYHIASLGKHNMEKLDNNILPIKNKIEKKVENSINIPVTNDDYLDVDLNNYNVKGILLQFKRPEGRIMKQIKLKIDNIG